MPALAAYPVSAEVRVVDATEPPEPTDHQVRLAVLEVGGAPARPDHEGHRPQQPSDNRYGQRRPIRIRIRHHKLEHAMYLGPDSVRAIIANRVSLDAAPHVLCEPHGVKDIARIRH